MIFKGATKSAVWLSASLCLALAIHSPALYAETPASPAPTSPTSDDDVDAVCAATLSKATAPTSPTGGDAHSQKLQYCQAAQSAQEGANADSALWKVWAGVGVVCTYACVASFTPAAPTSEYICMGASVAGGVTDAIVTKNFAGALMAVGGAAAGWGINQAMEKGGEAGKEAATKTADGAKNNKKDIGACLGAAMAAGQSITKFVAMQSQQETVHTNLASAKKVAGDKGTVGDPNGSYQPTQIAADGSGGNTGSGGSTGGSNSLADDSTAITRNSACASMKTASTPNLIMQCALSSDPTLPAFISDPKFVKEFQKDSGISLGDFLNKSERPAPLMAGAMSNGMSAGQSAKIAAALQEMANGISETNTAGGMYAGGGGGGAASSSDDDMAGLNQMMAGLMDQLNPGKKSEEKKTGVSAVIFANKTRSPASLVEDRTLGIFDRVTYRYYFVGRRIVLGEETK